VRNGGGPMVWSEFLQRCLGDLAAVADPHANAGRIRFWQARPELVRAAGQAVSTWRPDPGLPDDQPDHRRLRGSAFHALLTTPKLEFSSSAARALRGILGTRSPCVGRLLQRPHTRPQKTRMFHQIRGAAQAAPATATAVPRAAAAPADTMSVRRAVGALQLAGVRSRPHGIRVPARSRPGTAWSLLSPRVRRSLVPRVSRSLRFLRARLRHLLLWTLVASDNPR
jgi:hypothetical protein